MPDSGDTVVYHMLCRTLVCKWGLRNAWVCRLSCRLSCNAPSDRISLNFRRQIVIICRVTKSLDSIQLNDFMKNNWVCLSFHLFIYKLKLCKRNYWLHLFQECQFQHVLCWTTVEVMHDYFASAMMYKFLNIAIQWSLTWSQSFTKKFNKSVFDFPWQRNI